MMARRRGMRQGAASGRTGETDMKRRLLLGAMAAPVLATPALAQEAWPARPITLVVPWAPGGSNDSVARILAQPLAERLGQSVVVENRPGGGGSIGMGQIVRARPDGYQ